MAPPRRPTAYLVVPSLALALTACSADPAPSRPADPQPTSGAGPTVLATGLDVPWGLVLLEDGTALVGERDTATVWRVPPGQDPSPLVTVPGVRAGGEGGLLGLAVPPGGGGETLLAYLTTAEDNRVVRLDLRAGAEGGEPVVTELVTGIPRAGNHNGGRIEFGPDGYLYISTGDASDGALAQDPGSLAGKILRVDAGDGSPAPDNPAPASPVYSMGHRNVQGLAWDGQDRLWASEFGQDALDELNLIEAGGNYGWPEVEGPGGAPEFVDPVLTWATSEASPSGLAHGGDGALYLAALRGESLWRVPLGADGEVGDPERLLAGEYGRLRSVVAGPDGLWVLTNNTFRGAPAEDDDRMLHLSLP